MCLDRGIITGYVSRPNFIIGRSLAGFRFQKLKMLKKGEALAIHKKIHGKIAIASKLPIRTKHDLSIAYTPGVAEVSTFLAQNKDRVGEYTSRGNTIAVVSDGSAVLGLGNIGPEGALPVMEGKCILFKHFGDVDAIPIVLSTTDPEEIIRTVQAIAPTFGGINLEDIAAPNCFYIERELKKSLDIPVFHDDQWGASVVVLAGLINALPLVKKTFKHVRIVVSGAGAAGWAIVKLLHRYGATDILVVDRSGIICRNREGDNKYKRELAELSNPHRIEGDLATACQAADVFIGVSSGEILKPEMVATMNSDAIVFALANPVPEIMPDLAKAAGATIIATGRSDFPNQINNALVFPGIFRGALDNKIKIIRKSMLVAAAENLAKLVKNPHPAKIIPSIFDKGVMESVSSAIK